MPELIQESKMRVRNWCLGAALAAAAAIPISANAFVPDLTGNYAGVVDITLQGFTAENSGINPPDGSPPAFGNSCTGSSCYETTFGAGFIKSVIKHGISGPALWSDTTTDGTSVGFLLYGIADKSFSGNILNNVGATTGPFAGYNGKINLDLYDVAGGSLCFLGTGCITTADRTAVDQLTGLTDQVGGQLIAHIELVPGIVGSDPTVTLSQSVNSATDPATGSGSFYADCISGPACAEFGKDGFTTAIAGQLADFFAKFDVDALNAGDAAGNSTTCTTTSGGQVICNGWEEKIDDPANALAVPEPASLGLIGSALTFFGFAFRRRQRNKVA